MKKIILAVLAYVLPTFPLGYFWHLKFFAGYYHSLEVYRSELIIPFGLLSMVIQGIVWAMLYRRLFAGLPIGTGALRFIALALPLSWSFMALAVSAKHRMTSPLGYLAIETAFVTLHYVIVSPLIAAVYRKGA
ncbi:MAG: hypothetical protein JNL10_14890 [Verrucomicrobiales bacterium]|nr:hypothetical protein [Verrucomicrobiales bacterium]